MMKHAMAAFLVIALAGSGAAIADDDDCQVPMNQWQPREAVQKMAEARGWKVSRIKIDDGCYEIKGTDETGQRFKAKIDPATLATVKLKRKGQDHESREMRDLRQPVEAGGSGELPSNELFKTGKPPKIEVK
jgi:hypothetical protein